MEQNEAFSLITIQRATNGYIVNFEGENHDAKYVYQSLRITMRELKKMLKTTDVDDE